MGHIPRIFLDHDLANGANISLERGQAHYLTTVMRRRNGDPVRLFNGRDGEWRAEISSTGKREASLWLREQLRPQQSVPDLQLCFAPVKKSRTEFIVEKATELGVARLTPVITQFTQGERLRLDRMEALAREAAEQTERLDLPAIDEPIRLGAILDGWDERRPLVFCDEGGDAIPIADALQALSRRAGVPAPSPEGEGDSDLNPAEKLGLLVGPEGGFSEEERKRLRDCAFVRPVSLGPRILRADTAAAAALAVIQSHWGDWRA